MKERKLTCATQTMRQLESRFIMPRRVKEGSSVHKKLVWNPLSTNLRPWIICETFKDPWSSGNNFYTSWMWNERINSSLKIRLVMFFGISVSICKVMVLVINQLRTASSTMGVRACRGIPALILTGFNLPVSQRRLSIRAKLL